MLLGSAGSRALGSLASALWGPDFGLTPHLARQLRIVLPAGDHLGVGRPERCLENRQGALVERFCFRILPGSLIQHGQVVEGHGHIRVLRPQDLLLDRQGALVEALGLGIVALGVRERCQVVAGDGHLGVVRAITRSKMVSARR